MLLRKTGSSGRTPRRRRCSPGQRWTPTFGAPARRRSPPQSHCWGPTPPRRRSRGSHRPWRPSRRRCRRPSPSSAAPPPSRPRRKAARRRPPRSPRCCRRRPPSTRTTRPDWRRSPWTRPRRRLRLCSSTLHPSKTSAYLPLQVLAVSNVLTALIFSNSRNFETKEDTTRKFKPNW